MERLFTLDEAKRLLPRLRPFLEELRDAVTRLGEVQQRLAALPEAARTNGLASKTLDLERRAADLVQQAQRLVDQVHALGVEIKDPRTGLIDFRSPRDGRVICLCWRLGESDIQFWHELDAGFAGRQPLS